MQETSCRGDRASGCGGNDAEPDAASYEPPLTLPTLLGRGSRMPASIDTKDDDHSVQCNQRPTGVQRPPTPQKQQPPTPLNSLQCRFVPALLQCSSERIVLAVEIASDYRPWQRRATDASLYLVADLQEGVLSDGAEWLSQDRFNDMICEITAVFEECKLNEEERNVLCPAERYLPHLLMLFCTASFLYLLQALVRGENVIFPLTLTLSFLLWWLSTFMCCLYHRDRIVGQDPQVALERLARNLATDHDVRVEFHRRRFSGGPSLFLLSPPPSQEKMREVVVDSWAYVESPTTVEP